MTVVRRAALTYTEKTEGKKRNPFAGIIQQTFNTIGRSHIMSGHQIVPVMNREGDITNMKVTKKTDQYAILTDDEGDTFGVTFS